MYLSYFDDSLCYCDDNFAHYANFALLPLEIAYYKESNRKSYFSAFGYNFGLVEREFREGLIYEDSDFFEHEEIRFFSRFRNSRGCRPVNPVESEREILQHEMKNSTHMWSLHAKYLLKALDFWMLHGSEKLSEWCDQFRCAFREWEVRTKVLEYNSEDEWEGIGDHDEEVDDDGYFSDGE